MLMKTKNFTLLLPAVLFLLLNIAGGTAMAETYTHVFAKGDLDRPEQDVMLSGITWHQTELAIVGFDTGSDNRGILLGRTTDPPEDFKISTKGIKGIISKITINTAKQGRLGNGTVTVSVGGTEYGTATPSNMPTDYNFEGLSSGEIVINYKFQSAGAYIRSITIEYDNSIPSPELTFAKPSMTVNVSDGQFINQLSNPYNVEVSYSSSDETVAKVDGNGLVTPLSGGQTTISATYPGSGNYSAQVVSYKLDVTFTLDNLKEALTSKEGTYIVKFDNAVVSYARGRDAYLEDVNGGIYYYLPKANDCKPGDVFDGIATVTARIYNGKNALTSVNIEPSEGGTIPLTTVTIKELSENFSKYELRRIKVTDATLTNQFNSRSAKVSQGDDWAFLYDSSGDWDVMNQFETIPEGSTIDVTGYPVKSGKNVKIDVYETKDITVAPSTVTFSTNAKGGESEYYGTLFSDKALTLPSGVIASTVDYADGKLVYNWEYDETNVIPANTAVLVKSATSGDHSANVVVYNIEDSPEYNKLKGSVKRKIYRGQYSYFYILTFSNENGVKTLGFYWQAEDGHSVTNQAGKAYLELPTESALSAVKGFEFNGKPVTGIVDIDFKHKDSVTVHTLDGRCVNFKNGKLPKGVYVINGEKVIVE